MADPLISCAAPAPSGSVRLVWVASLITAVFAAAIAPPLAGAARYPVWVRLELIENTAEGPAYNRCQIETTLERGQNTHWRVFYGETKADAVSRWTAIRSGSACIQVESKRTAARWTFRGSPYLLIDLTLGPATVSGGETLVETSISYQKLTGFTDGDTAAYETRSEKRTLRITHGGTAVIPALLANEKETDNFRVRELLLKFMASEVGRLPPVEYGEIAVASDVPRAEIFLDGGFVGRTSFDGPFGIGTVRSGEREVIVRDASGRETRGVVQVKKGQRASLSLTLLKGSAVSQGGLRPLGRNPQGQEEFWREKDGAIVVRIPGGEFKMGSPDGQGEPSEHPQHIVRLKGFLMDKTEVTWGQYLRFTKAMNEPLPESPVWGMPQALPVSNVTWAEAAAYCSWTGGRLPTEAEWEQAARGHDSRQYPWGNSWEPWRCNTRDGGPHAPAPAGALPDCISPYGVLDLAGSVTEWCSDWFEPQYYANSPIQNPAGPEIGTRRVSRGGDWMSPSFSVRTASRQGIDPAWPNPMRGFRCVQDDPAERKQ